jgi:hypothetical protein
LPCVNLSTVTHHIPKVLARRGAFHRARTTITEVESWRNLQSANIEFTMKRLRDPITPGEP